MNIDKFLDELLPRVIEGVKDAEKAVSGVGQGKVKKQKVLDAIGQGFDAVAVFIPQAAHMKGLVQGVADKMIDAVVTVYNATGWDSDDVTVIINPGEVLK